MNLTKLENDNILVTGGAGFIGSNLCEELLHLKAKVTCLDNFSTGRRQNLDAIKDQPNFNLIEGDIRDLETCRNACAEKIMSCMRWLWVRFLGLLKTQLQLMRSMLRDF